MPTLRFPAGCLALLSAVTALADVSMPAIFSDHLVLQGDRTVPIWGRAQPGEAVTVTFAEQNVTTRANEIGRWTAQLAPLAAGTRGSLVITGHNRLVIQDVLVGEVWLAAGQSNMQLRVNEAARAGETAAAADLPAIRQFTVAQHPAATPADDCAGQWVVCQPDTVGRLSAAAFYFARDLHAARAVPVGIINASWGATPIEAWTSSAALATRPELAPLLAIDQRPPSAPPREGAPPREKNWPGYLFNGMIAPVIPYAIRGALWYQGENNANSAHPELYARQLPLLIEDWRKRWGENFPFAWVQLPNFQPKPAPTAPKPNWPLVREAMLRTLSLPHTGMVVAIDIGETDNIHPRNKQDVGHRLALWARARVYGEALPYSGPLPAGHLIADGKITVSFSHAEGGLVARGGALQGFMIAGADRQWVPAETQIRDGEVIVSSPAVLSPRAVRYAWANNPTCNLFNAAGLPASPFRTDDWEP